MTPLDKSFNTPSKLPHRITMPVGDWSEDGHEQYEEIDFLSSHPVEDLRKAYVQSVATTGLSFDHQTDHSALKICTEFEESHLSTEAQTRLIELGYDIKKIQDADYITPKEISSMILWFIQLSLPDFKYEIKAAPKKTYLNGNYNKDLNVQFGYGCFRF